MFYATPRSLSAETELKSSNADISASSAVFEHNALNMMGINHCKVKQHLTLIAEEVKLHSQKTHSLTESIRGRAFLLGTQLQDLKTQTRQTALKATKWIV